VGTTSASASGRGPELNSEVAAASEITSGRGAGVNNWVPTVSAVPADQFSYHVVVPLNAFSLLMIWFYRHKNSSCRWLNQCDWCDSKSWWSSHRFQLRPSRYSRLTASREKPVNLKVHHDDLLHNPFFHDHDDGFLHWLMLLLLLPKK